MSHYKPYPKYRPSGVEWLGDVPEGWEVRRLGFYFDERREKVSDKDYPALSVTKNGIVPQLETAAKTDDGDNRKKVCAGDFVINGRSDRKGSSGAAQQHGSVSLINIVLRPIGGMEINFTHHLLRSHPFQEEFYRYGKGIVADLWSTNFSEMKNIPLAAPPLPEQIQIAAFLDRECGKLDALQAKQERLIELLKEKRQALISHAVTKGLDPRAKLKPSGIEWLGDVPEAWAVTRMKFHVSRFEQGWSPQCEGRNKEDGEIGVLKVGCVNGGTFRVEEHKALPPELEPRFQYALKRGDLLISRANTRELVGSAAVVDRDHDDILLCDKLYRLRFHRGVFEIYLSHFLGTAEVRQQIELDASGASASMVNIGQDCIKELNLALPPLAEQRAIVAHLDEKCGKIDQLKAKAERAIELLKERRSALISAAVTGKIDVREAATAAASPP